MSQAIEFTTADEPLYEVVHGRRVEQPPTGASETILATTLATLLGAFARARRRGRVASETLFLLDEAGNLRRRPDLAFVSYDRWPRHRPIPRGEEAWAVVPDLAVEVVSPTNSADSVVEKVREYFEAGVRRVWVIYPGERLAYLYTSPRQNRIVGPDEAIDGEDVLPGLRLAMAEIFEDVDGTPA
jgi:Uma2 family endonuclease